MKAIAIHAFGGPDTLEEIELPSPEIGPDEILTRVHAAGVGPWDAKLRAGVMGTEYPLPMVLGSECSGVVEQVGSAVTDVGVGDEVYTYALQRGMYAELVSAPAANVSPKPASLSFEEAAGVPVAGITAHQAITEELAIRSGEVLLITGAAGGVGSFAVPLAKAAGAYVIAVAGAENASYVTQLGADEVYDYRNSDFVAAIRNAHPDGMDAAFDCVGGDTFRRSVELLRDGGRGVGTVPPVPDLGGRNVTVSWMFGRPDRGRLGELARLIDAGQLPVWPPMVLPWKDAARAHKLVDTGHVRGKVVLRVA